MKITKLLIGTAIAVSVGWSTSASAATLLYRNDLSVGTDYLGAAIAASSYTVTTEIGSISAYTLSSYNVVVYANQNNGIPVGDLAQLNAYISGGGRVIFDDWTRSNGFNGNQAFTGDNNLGTLTLTLFNALIGGPLSVTNPGWGTFSTGLSALTGGVVAGTFENSEAGIVVGNGGNTIVNGFLSDTVASQQLYTNELNSFAATTPLPSTWLMLLSGFVGLGYVAYRGTKKNAAALAAA
jgi:hypothetical protein